MATDTKVIYHLDDEDTPYLVKIPVPPESVTLADLKGVLRRSNCKYFFKSKDVDFGVVKEEITDDSSPLPLFSGKVVCYLELSQGSVVGVANSNNSNSSAGESSSSNVASSSGGTSMVSDSVGLPPPGLERGPGVGETRPPSFHAGANNRDDDLTYTTESDSLLTSSRQDDDDYDDITSVSQVAAERRRMEMRMRPYGGTRNASGNKPARLPGPGIRPPGLLGGPPSSASATGGGGGGAYGLGATETSSMMSSEIESSLYDTEDARSEASSRVTTDTNHTSVSQQRHRQKRRSKRRAPAHLARAGSCSSVTDSTMSLNCITVTLNMDTVNFLGISIVGQSNKFGDGDCGIYVGSIMKGGAVALDGRIEPGDMILQVNDISFESMTNDEAVQVLREVVKEPGPIKLVVAKCCDPAPSKSYFTVPRTEPVRPIDPGAWVAHTAAVRGLVTPNSAESYIDGPFLGTSRDYLLGDYPGRCASVTTLSASSIVSSHAETEKYVPLSNEPLSTKSDVSTVVRAMQHPDSKLEVRDRLWLKMAIKNAIIGSDAVAWLVSNVQGLAERREARKYADQLLKQGYLKQAVNKKDFSESCYYTFGDVNAIAAAASGMGNLSISATATAPHHHQHHHVMQQPPPAPLIPWGVATSTMQQQQQGLAPAPPPWNSGMHHQQQWGTTTTTGADLTGGGGMSIYNPGAPPPSANYLQMPYGASTYGEQSSYGVAYNMQPSIISSGGSNGSRKMRLAGSGSGSESDRSLIAGAAGMGGLASSVGSDGGFGAAMAAAAAAGQGKTKGSLHTFQGPPAYKAHC